MDKRVSSSAGRQWRLIRALPDHPLPRVTKRPLTTYTLTGKTAGWGPKVGMSTAIVLTYLLAMQYRRPMVLFPGGGAEHVARFTHRDAVQRRGDRVPGPARPFGCASVSRGRISRGRSAARRDGS